MYRKIRNYLIGFGALALVAGACIDNTTTTIEPTAATDELLQPVSFVQWEKTRQTMVPNIVVVDYWASWCVPCLERFDDMVAMQHEYASAGVQFVSLSLDDRGSLSDLEFARDFLRKQDAPFPHYLLDEEMLDGFDKIGIQSVPAVDIFGRDGERKARLTGSNPNAQFTEQDVENALIALLKP